MRFSSPSSRVLGLATQLMTVVALILSGSRPAVAAAPDLPPELRKVPHDAALFGCLDVAALWPTKLGEAIRTAQARDLDQTLATLKTEMGIVPEDLKTFVVFLPMLKQPGDFESPVFIVTFKKPYDRAKAVTGFQKILGKDKMLKELEPGVYGLFPAMVPQAKPVAKDAPPPTGEPKKVDKAAEPEFVFSLTDPSRIIICGRGSQKYLKDQPADATGAITPALQAAASGHAVSGGITFANFPDEIRGEDLPAEVRPFKALFTSEAAILTGALSGDTIKAELRFRSTDRTKVAEAEKALGAGVTLLSVVIASATRDLERSKDKDEKTLLPLVLAASEVVKSAKVSIESQDAVAQATIKTDLPVTPLLRQIFGSGPGKVTAASERAITQNNLKQIGLALHNYHDAQGAFPPAAVVGRKGKKLLSWRVEMLPYIEQDALYRQFKLDEPWDSEHNKAILDKNPMPKVFALPGVTKDGEKVTHLMAPVGKDTIFDPFQGTKIVSITDGTSNTILAVYGAKSVPWTKPEELELDPKADLKSLLLFNETGTNVLFADGSVRYLAKSVADDVLKALFTKSGGEVNMLDR